MRGDGLRTIPKHYEFIQKFKSQLDGAMPQAVAALALRPRPLPQVRIPATVMKVCNCQTR